MYVPEKPMTKYPPQYRVWFKVEQKADFVPVFDIYDALCIVARFKALGYKARIRKAK